LALTLIAPAATALAQSPVGGGSGVGGALKQAEALRVQRRFQEMLPVLQPFADSKSFDVYVMLGRAYEGLRLPEHCQTALDWHNKAIALQPNNPTGYERRAAAYDCLGNPYFEEELADRARVVDMAETGGKTASAGQINDLAGATLDMASPSGQGAVDFDRVQQALDLRSRAIAMTARGTVDMANRLMDRAELLNSRLKNPGAARADADEALDIVRTQLDMGVLANLYARAQINRRYANLGTTVIAALNQPGYGIFRPTQAQMRNEALDYYSRYIDAFVASGRDFAKCGSGIDAYTNRASVHNSIGDPASKRKAIDDYTKAFELNPREPRRLWDRAQRQLELGNNAAVRADIQQYLSMTKGVDIQGVNGRMLDLLRRLPG
jgi:tetratricopeptide (TPR) repeat protein